MSLRHLTTALLALALTLAGCHESLEQRAEREASDFTEKYCPTPAQNYVRTDSLTFDAATLTFHYFCTVTGPLDDSRVMQQNQKLIHDRLQQGLRDNTNIKVYKDAGYVFTYTMRSESDPKKVMFDASYGTKEYQ